MVPKLGVSSTVRRFRSSSRLVASVSRGTISSRSPSPTRGAVPFVAQTFRLADGPDEVHRALIAKSVLAQVGDGIGWDLGNPSSQATFAPLVRDSDPAVGDATIRS